MVLWPADSTKRYLYSKRLALDAADLCHVRNRICSYHLTAVTDMEALKFGSFYLELYPVHISFNLNLLRSVFARTQRFLDVVACSW